MSIALRLQKVIKDSGLSNTAFADKIGVQRSSISHVLAGRNKPSVDFIQKILSSFNNIDASWLIIGRSTEDKSQSFEPIIKESITKENKVEDEDRTPYQVSKQTVKSATSQEMGTVPAIKRIVVYYADGSYKETYPND